MHAAQLIACKVPLINNLEICHYQSMNPYERKLIQFNKAFDNEFSHKENLKVFLLSAFQDVFSTPPQGPAVITLGFHNNQEFENLKHLKRLTEKIPYNSIDYSISESSPEIISDLDKLLDEYGEKTVVFIQGSEKVSGRSLFEIHSITDEDENNHKYSILIFIFIDEAFKEKENKSLCKDEIEK